MIRFLKYSKFYLAFSFILIFLSIVFLFLWGLKFGVDFTGGSLLEIEFKEKRPAVSELRSKIKEELKTEFSLQEIGEKGVIIRAKNISEDQHQKILKSLGGKDKVIEKRFEMIGAVVGRELKKSTLIAVIVACVLITFYVAISFKKVSRPVSSFYYGIAAILALIHDVLITTGFFALFGKVWGMEVNVPFVAAILTILGYSVSDTIIVFDKTRENLIKREGEFEKIVDISLNETFIRCLFTSFTTLLPLFAMIFLGGQTLLPFVLALTVGIIVGSYSSICIAPPLLYYWYRFSYSKKEK